MSVFLELDPRRRLKRRRVYFFVPGPVGGATLDRIVLTQAPTETQYTDTEIDFTGLIITAEYSDGSSAEVQATPDIVIWGSEAVEQTVTFSYEGKTCTWSTTPTLKALDSISVETMPDETVYLISGTLDTTGLTIRKLYNNGDTAVISSGFTCSPLTFSQVGEQTITVSYTESGVTKTTSFNVTVNALSPVSLTVSGDWSNTQYVNTAPNTAGLTFTVTYDDESTATVTPVVSPSTWEATGEQTATFSYTENGITVSTTKTATVEEMPIIYDVVGLIGRTITEVNA